MFPQFPEGVARGVTFFELILLDVSFLLLISELIVFERPSFSSKRNEDSVSLSKTGNWYEEDVIDKGFFHCGHHIFFGFFFETCWHSILLTTYN